MGRANRILFVAALSLLPALARAEEAKTAKVAPVAEAAGFDLPSSMDKRANEELVMAMRERLRRITELVDAKAEISKLRAKVSDMEATLETLRREYNARGVELEELRENMTGFLKDMDGIMAGRKPVTDNAEPEAASKDVLPLNPPEAGIEPGIPTDTEAQRADKNNVIHFK